MPNLMTSVSSGTVTAISRLDQSWLPVTPTVRSIRRSALIRHVLGADLGAERDRRAAVVIGEDRLGQQRRASRLRGRRGQDSGPPFRRGGVVVPDLGGGFFGQVPGGGVQVPPVQPLAEAHVARLAAGSFTRKTGRDPENTP